MPLFSCDSGLYFDGRMKNNGNNLKNIHVMKCGKVYSGNKITSDNWNFLDYERRKYAQQESIKK